MIGVAPETFTVDGRGPWFAPLVAPRQRAVRAALSDASAGLGREPTGPRAGLLAALAHGIAWTWGESVDRAALRVGAAALEIVQELARTGAPHDLVPLARALDGQRLRAAAIRVARSRQGVLDAWIDRWARADVGRRPIPEAVLAFRGAVAVGCLGGGLDARLQPSLEALGTWLGLAWEEAAGPVSPAAWDGAWRALGTPTERVPAREGALRLLAELPPSGLTEALADSVRALGSVDGCRTFDAWAPRTPPLAAGTVPDCPVERALIAQMADGAPDLQAAARFLLRQGGKRVRPRLVLAAAEACGADPSCAVDAAAAVEWLHQASLVLDDILDHAEVRRGLPALHRATDIPFATGAAIWVLVRLREVAKGLPSEVAEALGTAAFRLADGQGSELVHTGDPALSETEHLRVLATKTGALFAEATAIGALCAGADARRVARFRRFGHEIGIAFQLVDDALDYTGDLARLGKAPGTDLRAHKPTLPWILRRAAGGAPPLGSTGPDALDAVRPCCDAVLERARTHRARAVAALEPSERTPALLALADALVERSA